VSIAEQKEMEARIITNSFISFGGDSLVAHLVGRAVGFDT
jgi:hypothetical protein